MIIILILSQSRACVSYSFLFIFPIRNIKFHCSKDSEFSLTIFMVRKTKIFDKNYEHKNEIIFNVQIIHELLKNYSFIFFSCQREYLMCSLNENQTGDVIIYVNNMYSLSYKMQL